MGRLLVGQRQESSGRSSYQPGELLPLYEFGLDPEIHCGLQWGSEPGSEVISLALEETAQCVATYLLPPLSPGSTRKPANPGLVPRALKTLKVPWGAMLAECQPKEQGTTTQAGCTQAGTKAASPLLVHGCK